MPIPKEKREMMILVGVITIVLLVGIYYLLIDKQWGKWIAFKEEIVNCGQRIEKAKKTIEEAEARKFELFRARRELDKIEKNMPPKDDPYSWAVKELAAHGDRHNLPHPDIRTASPLLRTKKEEFPGYKASAYDIHVNAGYDEGAELIRDLENTYSLAELSRLDVKLGTIPQNLSLNFIIEMLGNP